MDAPKELQLPTPADRIETLESALQLDSRLQVIEKAFQEKSPAARPWWRDAKTVTVLAALIAAVLPLLTWINNVYSSSRESRRLLIEQQEKIRQTYLDRVLRPGVGEAEQQRVFELLSMLSSDPEMQQWAKMELKRTTDTIVVLTAERNSLAQQLVESQKSVVSLNERLVQLQTQRQIQSLDRRIGASSTHNPLVCTLNVKTDPPDATVELTLVPGSWNRLKVSKLVDLPAGEYDIYVYDLGYIPEFVHLNFVDHCDPVFVKLELEGSSRSGKALR